MCNYEIHGSNVISLDIWLKELKRKPHEDFQRQRGIRMIYSRPSLDPGLAKFTSEKQTKKELK